MSRLWARRASCIAGLLEVFPCLFRQPRPRWISSRMERLPDACLSAGVLRERLLPLSSSTLAVTVLSFLRWPFSPFSIVGFRNSRQCARRLSPCFRSNSLYVLTFSTPLRFAPRLRMSAPSTAAAPLLLRCVRALSASTRFFAFSVIEFLSPLVSFGMQTSGQ